VENLSSCLGFIWLHFGEVKAATGLLTVLLRQQLGSPRTDSWIDSTRRSDLVEGQMKRSWSWATSMPSLLTEDPARTTEGKIPWKHLSPIVVYGPITSTIGSRFDEQVDCQ